MLKKIFIVLISFILVSCATNNEEEKLIDEYIAPVKDVFLFDELDNDLKQRIRNANGNSAFKNYQFYMLGKSIYENDLLDINGNIINFNNYDSFILEVLSTTCSHCRDSLKNNLDSLLELDTTIIQYFNVGDIDDIKNLYEDIDRSIPDNIIVIGKDEGLDDYLRNDIGIERYPTLISYKDNKISFSSIGDMDEESFKSYYEISFINILEKEDLIDSEGNDLLSLNRSVDDVKNDLSIENQNKINDLDNDGYTIEATYKLMGKSVDFTKMSNDKSSPYISEVDDFTIYEDSDLVLLFTFLKDETQSERIEYINELITSNDEVEYLLVLIEGIDNSSSAYKKMDIKANCPVVSVEGYIPQDFFIIGITSYPTALFIRNGVYTGVYSNIENTIKFNQAIEMFLGDTCISLTRNN